MALIASPVAADDLQKEKMAEGVYVKLVNGAAVLGSEQSWALWRLADGSFELENAFRVRENDAVELMAAIVPKYLSPELKADLQNKASQTSLRLHPTGGRTHSTRHAPFGF